jgi:hypothetical protein
LNRPNRSGSAASAAGSALIAAGRLSALADLAIDAVVRQLLTGFDCHFAVLLSRTEALSLHLARTSHRASADPEDLFASLGLCEHPRP